MATPGGTSDQQRHPADSAIPRALEQRRAGGQRRHARPGRLQRERPQLQRRVRGVVTTSVSGLATFTVNQPGNSSQPNATTFSGAINDGAGQVALVKTATGTLTLSGTSNYSGGTTLSNGSIVVTNPASLGATSGALSINSATLEVASGFSEARNINLTNNATIQVDAGQTYTNTGVISGLGHALSLPGAGTFVVAGSGSVGNTFLPVGGLTVNGQYYRSTEVLNVTSQNIGGSGQGSGQLSRLRLRFNTTGPATDCYYNSTAASTFAGTLAGGPVEVDGGNLTLTGSNTFSGGATVTGGALIAGAANALSPNSTYFISGGTLDASRYAQTIQSLTMTSGGSLNLAVGKSA